MKNNTVLVSMPLYNSEKTVALAIESILSQKHNNIILAIVDDCSTDSSLEIAKAYLSDPRVRLYKNSENMGAYYSRNYGIYANIKEHWSFFTTHDADDISYARRYATLTELLKRPNVLGAQDMFTRIDLASNKIISSKITSAHAIFKRSVLSDLGYFEPVRYGADWEYWERLKLFILGSQNEIVSWHKIMGDSYVDETNLTTQIPIGSKKRKNYMLKSKIKHKKMIQSGSFYVGFTPKIKTVEIKK